MVEEKGNAYLRLEGGPFLDFALGGLVARWVLTSTITAASFYDHGRVCYRHRHVHAINNRGHVRVRVHCDIACRFVAGGGSGY